MHVMNVDVYFKICVPTWHGLIMWYSTGKLCEWMGKTWQQENLPLCVFVGVNVSVRAYDFGKSNTCFANMWQTQINVRNQILPFPPTHTWLSKRTHKRAQT